MGLVAAAVAFGIGKLVGLDWLQPFPHTIFLNFSFSY